jgi:hypothetical protein
MHSKGATSLTQTRTQNGKQSGSISYRNARYRQIGVQRRLKGFAYSLALGSTHDDQRQRHREQRRRDTEKDKGIAPAPIANRQ